MEPPCDDFHGECAGDAVYEDFFGEYPGGYFGECDGDAVCDDFLGECPGEYLGENPGE